MSNTTSIADLQQLDNNPPMDGNGMAIVDQVIQNLDNDEHSPNNEALMQQQLQQQQYQQQMLAQQQQQLLQQQQQQQQLLQQQQQFAQPHPQYEQQSQLLPMSSGEKSFSQRLLGELKDVFLVVLVFVLLNFEHTTAFLNKAIGRVSPNPYVLLLAKSLVAGGLFFVVKKLALN
jgi:hypothetical protein